MKKVLILVALATALVNCKARQSDSTVKVDTDFSQTADGSNLVDLTRYVTPTEQHAEMEKAVKAAITPTTYQSYVTKLAKYREEAKAGKRSAPPEGLEEYEIHAIMHYTSSAYRTMNQALRKLGGKLPKDYEVIVKAASSGLNKIKGTDCTAYRGTSLPDFIFNQLREGSHYYDGAFLSSSYAKKSAFGGKHKLVIHSTNCKYVDSISVFPHEKEVLWTPGTDFLVTAIDGAGSNLVQPVSGSSSSSSTKEIFVVHRYLDKNEKLNSTKISWEGTDASSNVTTESEEIKFLNKDYTSVIYDTNGTVSDQKAVINFTSNGKGTVTLPKVESTGENAGTYKIDFNWSRNGQVIETHVPNRTTKTFYYIFSESKIGQLRAKNAEEINQAKEVVTYYNAD
jgi:hypothetical protein